MRALQRTAQPLRWLRDQVDAEERRLLVQAIVVGVVVWAFVTVLKLAVHHGFAHVAALLDGAPHIALVWLPLLAGALGVAAVAGARPFIVHYRDSEGAIHELDAVEGDGLERAIALYFSSEPALERTLTCQQGVEARWRMPTFSLTFRKMIASFLTLATGGAGGLEASVTLVGESTAAGLFKPRGVPKIVPRAMQRQLGLFEPLLDWWRASQPEDLQAAQLCGISAAIATLLGTPFAAAFFAIEVIYRRRPIVDRLIYALVSALIAFFLTHLATGAHSPFPAVALKPPLYDGQYYVGLFATAVSLGLLSSGFRAMRAWADHFFHGRFQSRVKRHLVGALVTGAFAVASGLLLQVCDLSVVDVEGASVAWLVLGTGENIIDWSLNGQLPLAVAVIALVGRFGATVSTIASGASAGLLFPTLCFGCLTAVCWAELLGIPAALLVVPSMTASLVSVANVPLAAILLVVEGFGSQWIVPGVFALVLASIFAHRNSIYRAQRETFDRGQILPGMSVRRMRVSARWEGRTLRGLGIREHFGLTVIGMIDRSEGADGGLDEHIVMNPSPDRELTVSDMLIVLGEDERIARLAAEADADD